MLHKISGRKLKSAINQ